MNDDSLPSHDSSHATVTTTRPRPILRQRSLLRALREAVDALVLVATIYVFVNLSSARFIVEGDSMKPNFHTGQFLIISRLDYLVGWPQRGDVVVFHYPLDPQTDFIKRVIGLPGEMVALRDGQVYVNNVALDEPYIREACSPLSCPDNAWPIGENQYFVMGDNRNESRDSRVFGPVDRSYFVGEALLHYWPPSDWGRVAAIRYPAVLLSN